jgi:hypothetical protein
MKLETQLGIVRRKFIALALSCTCQVWPLAGAVVRLCREVVPDDTF